MVHNQADPLTVSPSKNNFLIPEKNTEDTLYEQTDALVNKKINFLTENKSNISRR